MRTLWGDISTFRRRIHLALVSLVSVAVDDVRRGAADALLVKQLAVAVGIAAGGGLERRLGAPLAVRARIGVRRRTHVAEGDVVPALVSGARPTRDAERGTAGAASGHQAAVAVFRTGSEGLPGGGSANGAFIACKRVRRGAKGPF